MMMMINDGGDEDDDDDIHLYNKLCTVHTLYMWKEYLCLSYIALHAITTTGTRSWIID